MIDATRPLTCMTELENLVRQGITDWSVYGDVRAIYKKNLVLFNYGAKAHWENRWNWFERVSRGLILDIQRGEVVARPLDKFWNWGERGRTTQAKLREVTVKYDGSLGIMYRQNGQHKVATRGSFDSEQAIWATDFLQHHYDLSQLDPCFTLLFEIIYPENRIVVDYGERKALVLIGVRNRWSGADLWMEQVAMFAHLYGFWVPDQLPHRELAAMSQDRVQEIADSLDGTKQEGFVLRFADGQRFKIKARSYVELHRIVTQATLKRVAEAVMNGSIENVLKTVPSELLGEIHTWREQIVENIGAVKARIEREFAMAPQETRKQFALWVNRNCPDDASYLFLRLDGRDYMRQIWRKEYGV